eukprot:3655305-Rhodomonas_salina.2
MPSFKGQSCGRVHLGSQQQLCGLMPCKSNAKARNLLAVCIRNARLCVFCGGGASRDGSLQALEHVPQEDLGEEAMM